MLIPRSRLLPSPQQRIIRSFSRDAWDPTSVTMYGRTLEEFLLIMKILGLRRFQIISNSRYFRARSDSNPLVYVQCASLGYGSGAFHNSESIPSFDGVMLLRVAGENHEAVIFERKINEPMHLLYTQKSRLIDPNNLVLSRVLQNIVLLEL